MIKSLKKNVLRIFFKLRTSDTCRNLINKNHKSSFFYFSSKLTKKEEKVVHMLKEQGFYSTSLSSFFSERDCNLIMNQAMKAKSLMTNDKRKNFKINEKKQFLVRYSENVNDSILSHKIGLETLCGRFSEIARHYFSQNVRLTNCDYWLNLPAKDNSEPYGSQLWHRDYEDKQLLKIFLYFNKVNDEQGPLSFIKKSHFYSKESNIFPVEPPLGVVVSEKEVKKYFNPSRIKTFRVNPLSLLFVDTSGLHKGGFCTKGSRFIYTATYTSFAGISKRIFKPHKNDFHNLTIFQKNSITK